MSMTIRPATEEDIDSLYEISCSVHLGQIYRDLIPETEYERFAHRYTPSPQGLARFYEKFISRLFDPEWHIWVAAENDEVTGFTVAHDQGKALLLKGLFVTERHQGKGAGKSLFEASCAIAKPGQSIILEVLESNSRAIKLYEKQGFQKTIAVADYYGGPMIQMYKD